MNRDKKRKRKKTILKIILFTSTMGFNVAYVLQFVRSTAGPGDNEEKV